MKTEKSMYTNPVYPFEPAIEGPFIPNLPSAEEARVMLDTTKRDLLEEYVNDAFVNPFYSACHIDDPFVVIYASAKEGTTDVHYGSEEDFLRLEKEKLEAAARKGVESYKAGFRKGFIDTAMPTLAAGALIGILYIAVPRIIKKVQDRKVRKAAQLAEENAT